MIILKRKEDTMEKTEKPLVPLPAPLPQYNWLPAEEVERLPFWYIEEVDPCVGRFGEVLFIRAQLPDGHIFIFTLPSSHTRRRWANLVLHHTSDGYLVGPCRLERRGPDHVIVPADIPDD
jgi:hypothetical protein